MSTRHQPREGTPTLPTALGRRVRLDELPEARCATVCEVRSGFAEVVRLKAMGVCRGRRVRVMRRGDPLILEVLGTRLGLSSRLAAQVDVEPCTCGETESTIDACDTI